MEDVTCVCGSEMTRVDGDLFKCEQCGALWEFSGGYFDTLNDYVLSVYGVESDVMGDVGDEELKDMLSDIRHDYAMALASGEGDDELANRQKWALLAAGMALPENCRWVGGYGAYSKRVHFDVSGE